MKNEIIKAAEIIVKSSYTVALTGAGISVESGIPPFRGKGGLWEKYDPMEVAHISSFIQNPARVWKLLLSDMHNTLLRSKPNDAHHGLARLEELGLLRTVITQNVDGLHQMAGNTDVIEFHGTFADLICMSCGHRCKMTEVDVSRPPPQCDCGGIFRPDAVFFGEMIPAEVLDRSRQAAAECDVMLVVGTSAVVQPAALMPVIANQAGAFVIEINPEETPLTASVSRMLLKGKAGDIMRELVSVVEQSKMS